MSNKCSYRLTSGRFCRRWANHGQGFCYVHQPDPAPQVIAGANLGVARYQENDVAVPPLSRLATPRDLFDVVRESINAVRLGRMAPAQAFAISALVSAWVRARNELKFDDRNRMLRQQMLPTLAEEDRLADDHLESSEPPAPAGQRSALPASEISNLKSPVHSFAPPLSAPPFSPDPRIRPGMTMDEAFDALCAISPAPAAPSTPGSPPASRNLTSAVAFHTADPPAGAPALAVPPPEISNLESDLPAQQPHLQFQQIDLVAAHKALAEKMGWVPDDGSDLDSLDTPITPPPAAPASRSG